MRRIFSIFLLVIIGISCSTRDEIFNDIELMSYHWSNYDHSTVPIKFHVYALIDNSGIANVCVHKIYPGKQLVFFSIKIDNSLICNVLKRSDEFLNDSNMSYKKITDRMMDEALIKLRINQNKLSKTINFINTDQIPGIYDFMKLFKYIDSIYMTGKYQKLTDTIYLINRLNAFINYSIKIDTTLIPTPPPDVIQQIKTEK